MGYHILVVEDDPQIAESLTDMLEILDHKVVGVCASFEEAVNELDKEETELALLDIQIKGEKSGIDLAEYIRANHPIPFIFTTAYADNDTIKKASMHSPYGYIVKPYGMKDINAGIEIAIKNHLAFKDTVDGEDQGIFNSESLFIKANSRIVRVNIKDILFVEAKGDYAVFKTADKGFVVQTTFKNVEAKLNPNQFVKVHRSFIINLEKIVDIEDSSLLIADHVIPISRGQKPHLLTKLKMI